MELSRAHTFAKAADVTTLLLTNKHQVTQAQCGDAPPNRSPNSTLINRNVM